MKTKLLRLLKTVLSWLLKALKASLIEAEKAFRLILWGALATLGICALGVSFGFEKGAKLTIKPNEAEASLAEFGKLTPDVMAYMREVARAKDLSPHLVAAMIGVESQGDPWIGSDAGALGVMQVTPKTARDWCKIHRPQELWDIRRNIDCGTTILRRCLDENKNVIESLACYNGSGKCKPDCKIDGKVTFCRWNCRETFEYIGKVVNRLNKLEERERRN